MRTFSAFLESLALKGNYKLGIFQQLVAAFYKSAPVLEERAVPCFLDLQQKLLRQYGFLQSKFVMQPTYQDPYKSMKQLSGQIRKQYSAGVRRPEVKVFAEPPGPEDDSRQQGHPLFDNNVNVKIRWVHDLIAHFYGQHPFSARGEYGAYNRHLKTLCNPQDVKSGKCLAAKALFTEIVGQTSYYYVYGDYTQQKVIILDQFDHAHVGRLAEDSKLNDLFIIVNKDLVPRMSDWRERLAIMFPAVAKEFIVP